jgi:hypothetical protein
MLKRSAASGPADAVEIRGGIARCRMMRRAMSPDRGTNVIQRNIRVATSHVSSKITSA